MKKLISLLLVLAMALSLVACGASDAPAAEAPKADAPAAERPAFRARIGFFLVILVANFLKLAGF